MLTAIRDRATGWIAYVIIFLISIPFALWGINSFFEGGGDDRVAAIVNGEEIPVREYLNQFQQQKRYIQSVLGENPSVQYSDELIKGDVIRNMIQRELIRQQVDEYNFQISDETLSREISQTPAFSIDGKFSPDQYRALLQSRRQPASEYEAQLRQQLRIQQFNDGIVNSAFVPPSEKKRFLELENQQRDVSYFTVTEDSDKYHDEITDDEIKEFYDNNSAQFQSPEQVKVAYIEIDKDKILEQIDVPEDKLREIYEQESERFTTDEKRKFRQIIFKLPQGSPSSQQYNEEFSEKEKLVGELVEKLRDGGDFTELAGEYSEDSETASTGGQMGFESRNDLEESLGEAVFGMEPGEVSEPVATSVGIHILEVQDIKPPAIKEFDKVRDDIREEYLNSAADERYYDLANTIQNIAFEQPDSLQSSSDASGLEIKQSDWFSRQSGQDIGQHDKVRQAAFKDTVLTQGRNSDVLEISDGYALVLHLQEHKDSKTKPLEDVANDVRDILASMKATDAIKEKADQAIADIRDGASMEEVAEKLDVDLESPGFVSRQGSNVPSRVSSKLFTMEKPGNGPLVEGLKLANGEYVVIQLASIKPGDIDDDTTASQKSLDSNYGTREWQAMMDVLEAGSEVQVYQESIDNL